MYYYQRLRDLREDSDKKQYEIAQYLGIKQEQYHLYESGKREIPFHMVIQLAKLYNVSIDYIADISEHKLGLSKITLTKKDIQLIEDFHSIDKQYQIRISERLSVYKELKNAK